MAMLSITPPCKAALYAPDTTYRRFLPDKARRSLQRSAGSLAKRSQTQQHPRQSNPTADPKSAACSTAANLKSYAFAESASSNQQPPSDAIDRVADSTAGSDRLPSGNAAAFDAPGSQAPAVTQQLADAQNRIRSKQKEADDGETYGLVATQRLVETAMLAAVSGLAYALATIIHLESYLGYFLPLPVVVAAMRNGPAASRKTVSTTFFLLLVLLGPVKALTYVFSHGLMAVALGVCWCHHTSWTVSIAAGTLMRIAGQAGFMLVLSWVTHENVFSLAVTGATSTLDQMRSWAGMQGKVSHTAVVTGICCSLAVNAVFYLFFMHVVYFILLSNMGYRLPSIPKFVLKMLYGRADLQSATN